MMKINVATLNDAKVKAVKEMAAKYHFLKNVEVKAVSVPSSVSDQPKSLEETIDGAMNRAKNAFIDCDLSFGIESGLMVVPKTKSGFMDVCACAIYDGKEFHLGLSSAFDPPRKVIDMIMKEGVDMTAACNLLGITNNPKLGAAEGLIGILSNGRLTRQIYTSQAIVTALIHLENSHLFR